MKVLKRMLLIHWHYFVHEMIEFDRINLLTGKNSSGKSTIIDAMQLVLLSDTSGSFFNKAASARGDRTLIGYLRCELGDDEDAGFRYLRGTRFTSYIALEFEDTAKGSFFTVGCCFDVFGENDVQRMFFRIDGPIPENEFVDTQGKPLSIEELRAFIRANYAPGQSYTTNVNRDFREILCGSLGGLQTQRFTDLIKKAVSFDPKVDIRQFITEFVCGDELEINISDMKENIRSYDTLKKETQLLVERIEMLAKIGETHTEFVRNRDNETLYGYLLARSAWEMKADEIEQCNREAERLADELGNLREKLGAAEDYQKQLQSERDVLKLQLDSNEDARRLEELRREIEDKKRKCKELVNEYEAMTARLYNMLSSWRSWVANISERIKSVDLTAIDTLIAERIEAACAEGVAIMERAEFLRDAIEQGTHADVITQTGADKLAALGREADDYRVSCAGLSSRLYDAQEETARKVGDLVREKEQLEKGVYTYPRDAVDLKEAIESRLRSKFGPDAKAVIFAEAVEIPGDRWRNVIEGYLNTQKFYIIVAPEHFYTAFQLYDSIKRQKTVYATGLVDTEKLQRLELSRDAGSLAEELETSDPAVQMFIDFTLGRVHKSDTIKDLRKHRSAITDDGVLYQNFVVRAMDPKRWQNPAIGSGGARLRLAAVNGEIEKLRLGISVYAAMIPALKETDSFMRIDEFMADQIVGISKQYHELPVLEEAIARLTADAQSIEDSEEMREIETLRQRLAEREAALGSNMEQIRKCDREITLCESGLQTLEGMTLPKLEDEEAELKKTIASDFDLDWIGETGSHRYERELAVRGSADEINRAFPRELSRSRNAKDEAWNQTRDLRFRYNETYRTGYNINAPDNEAFDSIWLEFTENRLPEYEAKIEDTRQKAFQQFREDFLSKLQSNIFSAKRHIDELNASMKGANFGDDVYQFRATASPDYKRYHDMIVDEMLIFGGYNLLSDQYNAKYKDEMAELFEIITNDSASPSAQGYEDYEKRVQQFTDYKTYLRFDLEVTKPNGDTERLSKTMGKKSGGETQTPFYIAVLASFVQLYRMDRDRYPGTVHLILFDEAFSKMDGERIIQSIDLLRRFKFQVILAAPPDKIPDIASLADRNLCVLRSGVKTCVRAFDPREIEEYAELADASGDAGDAGDTDASGVAEDADAAGAANASGAAENAEDAE